MSIQIPLVRFHYHFIHLGNRIMALLRGPRGVDFFTHVFCGSLFPLTVVLASSTNVLCVCVLFVFLLLSAIHHSSRGAAPNTHC